MYLGACASLHHRKRIHTEKQIGGLQRLVLVIGYTRSRLLSSVVLEELEDKNEVYSLMLSLKQGSEITRVSRVTADRVFGVEI